LTEQAIGAARDLIDSHAKKPHREDIASGFLTVSSALAPERRASSPLSADIGFAAVGTLSRR
jgi:hypothetical protein